MNAEPQQPGDGQESEEVRRPLREERDRILEVIKQNPDSALTASEVTTAVGSSSPSSVQGFLNELERDGFLERDDEDRYRRGPRPFDVRVTDVDQNAADQAG